MADILFMLGGQHYHLSLLRLRFKPRKWAQIGVPWLRGLGLSLSIRVGRYILGVRLGDSPIDKYRRQHPYTINESHTLDLYSIGHHVYGRHSA